MLPAIPLPKTYNQRRAAWDWRCRNQESVSDITHQLHTQAQGGVLGNKLHKLLFHKHILLPRMPVQGKPQESSNSQLRYQIWTALNYLNFRTYFNCLLKATQSTQGSHCLPSNPLKFSQFPSTATPILQNALCVFPKLWNVHQSPRQNLRTEAKIPGNYFKAQFQQKPVPQASSPHSLRRIFFVLEENYVTQNIPSSLKWEHHQSHDHSLVTFWIKYNLGKSLCWGLHLRNRLDAAGFRGT